MIANQVKGKCFRGVLNYLHYKEGSRLIGNTMAGKTPEILAAEFAVARQLNLQLKKPVYHSSLSLPKTEHLSDDRWNAIADEYLKGMGFTDSQYVVYRHSDKDHDHIHLVASRIRITDGTTVNDSWDYPRSEKLVRELENKYELTSTVSSNQKYQRGQANGERQLIERTGEESVRAKLQQAIDKQTQEPITALELFNRLNDGGIEARISLNKRGKIKGISYSLNGVAMSGTHLGKAYTFPGLQKYKKVSYDENFYNKTLIVEESQQARQLQAHRSSIIGQVLLQYANSAKTNKLPGKHFQFDWRSLDQTLLMYRKEDNSLVMAVKYQNQKIEPLELLLPEKTTPLLKEEDVKYWQKYQLEISQSQEIITSKPSRIRRR